VRPNRLRRLEIAAAVVVAAMAGIAIAVVVMSSGTSSPSALAPATVPTHPSEPAVTGVTRSTSAMTSDTSAGAAVSEAQREHAFAADLLVLGDNDPFRLVPASQLISLGQTVCQGHRNGVAKSTILAELTGFDRQEAVLFYDTAIGKLCPR
jgi:hypothetical protein